MYQSGRIQTLHESSAQEWSQFGAYGRGAGPCMRTASQLQAQGSL